MAWFYQWISWECNGLFMLVVEFVWILMWSFIHFAWLDMFSDGPVGHSWFYFCDWLAWLVDMMACDVCTLQVTTVLYLNRVVFLACFVTWSTLVLGGRPVSPWQHCSLHSHPGGTPLFLPAGLHHPHRSAQSAGCLSFWCVALPPPPHHPPSHFFPPVGLYHPHCLLSLSSSWYNHPGWLGIKNPTYLLIYVRQYVKERLNCQLEVTVCQRIFDIPAGGDSMSKNDLPAGGDSMSKND